MPYIHHMNLKSLKDRNLTFSKPITARYDRDNILTELLSDSGHGGSADVLMLQEPFKNQFLLSLLCG